MPQRRTPLFTLSTLCTAVSAAFAPTHALADPFVIGHVVPLESGFYAQDVAIGDLNSDGAQDLVLVGSSLWGAQLSIRIQDPATHTLAAAAEFPAGQASGAPTVVDLNGDGRNDVLVAGAGGVTVLWQAADGSFTPSSTFNLGFSGRTRVVDLNGDARLDLAGSVSGFAIQDEYGSFVSTSFPLNVTTNTSQLVTDLDADGRAEILVGGSGVDGLRIYKRGADGMFVLSRTVPMQSSEWVMGLDAGDFNGDGRKDLLVSEFYASRVLLQGESGVFDDAQAQHLEGRTLAFYGGLEVVDVGQDGKNEIVAYPQNDQVVFYSFSAGTMVRIENYLKNSYSSIEVGDINGDGLPDLAAIKDSADFIAYGIDTARPSANAGADRTVVPGTSVVLDGRGSTDADGIVADFRWVPEEGITLSETGVPGQVQFDAPYGSGDRRLKLIVWDNVGASATDEVIVSVRDSLPVANAGPDRNIVANSWVTLDGTGSSDPEGSLNLYLFSQLTGPYMTLVSAGVGKVQFRAPFGNQSLSFQLGVRDEGYQWGYDTVVLNVVDNPPGVNAGVDQTVPAGRSVSLAGTAVDEGSVTYAWRQVAGPSVTLQQSAGATTSFIAPYSQGTVALTFELTATDVVGNQASDQLVVTVTNNPPTVNGGEDRLVTAGGQVTLSATASDAEGLASVSWEQLSGTPVTLGGSGATRYFTPTQSGTLLFRATAVDHGGNTASDDVTITVNSTPIANAGADIAAAPQQSVVLDGTASSDLEGPIASYQWTQVSGPAVTLSSAGTGRVSFAAPYGSATREFQLTVTDSLGTTATDRVLVTVTDGAPTARAGADQSVTAHSTVTLDGTASSDVEGAIASFSWRQVAGPQVSLQSGALPGTASFTAPYGSGTFTFELTVTDLGGNSSIDQVVVTATDLPPTAAAGADKAVKSGNIVTLDATASSDREGPLAAYAWRQIAGTAVTLTQSGVPGRVTFTAPSVKSTTVLVFEVRVTDQAGQTAADQVNVTVSKR